MSQLLRLGSTGSDVVSWKSTLHKLGLLPGFDLFDESTDAATRTLQQVARIKVDGIVGPNTRAAATAYRAGPRQLPKVATPLTEQEIVDVLSAGHASLFGTLPSTPRLACAWAHVMHENGRGRAIWCNNLGNITAFGWRAGYYVIRVQERVQRNPDVWKWVDLKFRAHETIDAGAVDYWKIMSGRYAPALALFDEGRAAGAAMKLSELGFFTALPEAYARSLASLYRDFPNGAH